MDSFHAYEQVGVHWSLTVQNRLEGFALVLLSEELEQRANDGRDNARRLADRIGELGGAITGDPGRFIQLSPVDEFVLPENCANVYAILQAALRYERLFIDAYSDFCRRVRDTDFISYDVVIRLLKYHVRREDELEMALSAAPPSEGER
jgi:ferritin-like protein